MHSIYFVMGFIFLATGCGKDPTLDRSALPDSIQIADTENADPTEDLPTELERATLLTLVQHPIEIEIAEIFLNESGAVFGNGLIEASLSWNPESGWESFLPKSVPEYLWPVLDRSPFWPREVKVSRPISIPPKIVESGLLEFSLKVHDFAFEDELLADQKVRIHLNGQAIGRLLEDGEWITPLIRFENGHVIFRISKKLNPN